MPTSHREEPPFFATEQQMLDAWLDFHRATLLAKCVGLTDDQLKTRSVLPSSMSLLGLVRHLTEVERNWFARALAGDPPLYSSGTSPDWAFDEVAAADAAADLARYEDEVRRSRRVAAALHDLDAAGSGIRDGRPVSVSLRWIYLHMIEEYARHNGHADYLRERIDGVTGV